MSRAEQEAVDPSSMRDDVLDLFILNMEAFALTGDGRGGGIPDDLTR